MVRHETLDDDAGKLSHTWRYLAVCKQDLPHVSTKAWRRGHLAHLKLGGLLRLRNEASCQRAGNCFHGATGMCLQAWRRPHSEYCRVPKAGGVKPKHSGQQLLQHLPSANFRAP
jgi:hypothetical protein